MGRSQRIKDAAFEIDALFQEIFPEVADQDPMRLRTLLNENPSTKEAHAETEYVANA